MPLYEYRCNECKKSLEKVSYGEQSAPMCCNKPMARVFSPPALIRIKGKGYPSRQKWMDNWTPNSQPFSTGSQHGERY